MNIQLATRVDGIKPSTTIAITTKAIELNAAGIDVIGLEAGEPDFDTPEHIKEAAIAAIHVGKTRYTAVDGTISLKKAVQAKFKRDNGLDYDLDQILVSSGGKQSFFNLAQAFLDKGSEVIIPAPYWVSYPEIVRLADATPIFVKAEINQGYKITPEQLANAITEKTRLFVLNSPSNPTGAVYSKAELSALGKVLLKYPNVFVATDDIYEKIIWTKEPYSNILNACPELYDRTIVLNGVSKAYAMTGWRIGYAAGPTAIIKAMKKVQSQSTSNPCSVSQAAAQEALNGPQECLTSMVSAFKQRHQKAVDRINQIQGIKAVKNDGAFYIFPDCSLLIKRLGLEDDVALANFLMEKARVAVVPGSAFGLKNCIRISYACSEDRMVSALNRIDRAVSK